MWYDYGYMIMAKVAIPSKLNYSTVFIYGVLYADHLGPYMK